MLFMCCLLICLFLVFITQINTHFVENVENTMDVQRNTNKLKTFGIRFGIYPFQNVIVLIM